MWDLIVSVPDHCLSFYFAFSILSRPYAVKIYLQQRGTLYPGVICPPSLNPHVCFHFYVLIKGLIIRPGYLKFLKALHEDTGNNFSYLIPMNTVRIYVQQMGTLYLGVKCPCSTLMYAFIYML